MNAHLLYRGHDFDLERPLPPNEGALTHDLALNTLLAAMANGDKFVFQVAQRVLLSGLDEKLDTILYRQAVLRDCLQHPDIVKSMYDAAVEALEIKRNLWWFGHHSNYPGSILHGSVELMQALMELLDRLKRVADAHSGAFASEGFARFFSMLQTELTEAYFARVNIHLKELKFRHGVLISAELGPGNQGTNYVLRKASGKEPRWFDRFFAPARHAYTFRIHDRDEAGARALGELRDRGINLAANALAQSADHVLNFFIMLKRELAFYLGCVQLHRRLVQKGAPVCFPVPAPPGARRHRCTGLRDACLVLAMERSVIGNDLDADGKTLCIVTGANQGGKSTFLRSIGLAQLMMQCGMFVTAESFSADICRSLFTHYKREEDATLQSGKLDEELGRMSGIVDALTPNAMLLFNESFAATNEREGSEIAAQILLALLSTPVKIFFVTHLYEFARRLAKEGADSTLFLRAEREAGGQRTFKVLPGQPLESSFGEDVYKAIFKAPDGRGGESCLPPAHGLREETGRHPRSS